MLFPVALLISLVWFQMQSYLPKDSSCISSGYAEGGGLYALGLIHANHGGDITEYLLGQVKDAGSEQIKHGGCLGLGLAAMGTHREEHPSENAVGKLKIIGFG